MPETFKRVKGHDAIAKKADELHRECISLRASLEKFAGADLKASDRLKEVEDRLRVASDDMDSARKEFSKKKRAFDVVAKARWVFSDKCRAIVRKGVVLQVPAFGCWQFY